MTDPFELPGYEILEKLGEGGMSMVWKARQVSLDRLVAIKTLSASYLPDADALARFRREAQAAARLNHPGIVQVYDAGEAEGVPYLVMEYIDGCTVADLLERSGKLTEKNALLVAEGVAAALGYAWDKDCIIHCDVKPDNVLVERDGSIKIADLGLARFIGLHRRGAADEMILGTPNYTSPEQAEGVPDLDCRCDIYSLGAMLYHLTTGSLPFAGSPGSTAMDRHRTDYLPDPVEVNPELSAGIAWLIEKMMVKDRAYRTPYWSTVLADVREVKEGRVPQPPYPEPGFSTVARSAARLASPPAPAPKPHRQVRVAAQEGGPRKRLVVAATERTEEAGWNGPDYSVGRALFSTLLLLALAAAVYGFLRMGIFGRIHLRTAVQQEETVVAPPAEVNDDVTSAGSIEVDWGQEPRPERGMKDGQVVWDNVDFQQGARLFNEALALYEEYQHTRSNPAVLTRVESMAREAIRRFDSCKALAPPDVDVPAYISNCYHLISDSRHSTLLAPEESPRRASAPEPEFSTPAGSERGATHSWEQTPRTP